MMTTDKPTTIDRVERTRQRAANHPIGDQPTWADIDFLLSEVERLKAENERLQSENHRLRVANQIWHDHTDSVNYRA